MLTAKKFLERNEAWILLLLVALAILLRDFYVHQVFAESGTMGWNDAKDYVRLGESIAAGNWEQIAHTQRPPLIPFLIALFAIVFKDPISPFLTYNVIVTALMIPVMHSLGKELFNPLVGWFMALWAMFFHETYVYSTQVLKEPTFLLLFPLALLFMVRSLKGKRPIGNILLSALSFSLLLYAGERFLAYFPVFILLLLFIKPFTRQLFLRYSLLWGASVFLLLLPWTIRNYNVHDQLVIVSKTTTPITSHFWGDDLMSPKLSGADSARLHRFWDRRNEQAREFGEKHGLTPRHWGKTEASIRSFLRFWRPFALKPHFTTEGLRGVHFSLTRNLFDMAFFGVFLPFYFFGLFVLFKKKNHAGLVIASIPFIHSLTHAWLVWSTIRHRAPVAFVVALLGSFVINEMINGRIKLRNWRIVIE